jgi:hypothetical protein
MAMSPSMALLRHLPDDPATLWWRFATMFNDNRDYQFTTAGHFLVMHEAMTLKHNPRIFYQTKHWTRHAVWYSVECEATTIPEPEGRRRRFNPADLFTSRKRSAILRKIEELQDFMAESPTFVGKEEELPQVRELLWVKESTDEQHSEFRRHCRSILKGLRG